MGENVVRTAPDRTAGAGKEESKGIAETAELVLTERERRIVECCATIAIDTSLNYTLRHMPEHAFGAESVHIRIVSVFNL